VIVSVQLTVQTAQYRYVVKCPDGAHFRIEDGVEYAVVPSPFEVDDFGEMLWLNERLLLETARAGAWGFYLVSETALTTETACQPRPLPPVTMEAAEWSDNPPGGGIPSLSRT
jgi:hypothetical protein